MKPALRSPIAGAIAIALAAGCALQRHQPVPLAPERAAEAFAARSLHDPGLVEFLARDGVAAGPERNWSLRELVLVAAYYHPELAEARARVRAAEASRASARRGADPGLRPRVERHGDVAQDGSRWSVGAELSLPVDVGGRREARAERADRLADAEVAEAGSATWKVRSALRTRYVARYGALGEARLAEAQLAAAHALANIVERRVAAGMASALDLGNAQRAEREHELALQSARQRAEQTLAELTRATGLPPGGLAGTLMSFSDLESFPAPAPERLRERALRGRGDIRAAIERYAAAEAALKLEVARQYPDFELSPGYLWDQGDNVWSIALALTLPMIRGNAAPIEEAIARRDLEAARFAALQAGVISELAESVADYRRSLERLDAARRLAAAAAQQRERVERRAAAGVADRLDVVLARAEALAAEQNLHAAMVAGQEALGRMEDAIEQPLDAPAPSSVALPSTGVRLNP